MQATSTQHLTTALLTRALERSGVPYGRDCDGDLYALISGETPEEYLQCWFLIEGETYKIFQLFCLVQPPIAWENLADALIACNHYHETYRFGRLFLQPADEPQAGISLRFEGQIDLSAGVSEALLRTYIESHLANICAFLAQAFKNKKLFGSRPPKRSRKQDSPAERRGRNRKGTGK